MTGIEPMSLLYSFHYARTQPDVIERIHDMMVRANDHGIPFRLLVDSGAFSADTQGIDISVDDYAEWLTDICIPRWGPWMSGAFSLDVLRDPVASWNNWTRLTDLGVDTIPVVHMGADMSEFDRYADAGCDYIGFGGMVRRSLTRKKRWATAAHIYLREHHPQMRAHGLGVNTPQLMRLPWWSVDSTAFTASFRFGRLLLFDPRYGKLAHIDLTGRSGRNLDAERLLRGLYRVDPAEALRSDKDNRPLLAGLTGKANEEFQRFYRQRHQIPSPASRPADTFGPHCHNVLWVDDVELMLDFYIDNYLDPQSGAS